MSSLLYCGRSRHHVIGGQRMLDSNLKFCKQFSQTLLPLILRHSLSCFLSLLNRTSAFPRTRRHGGVHNGHPLEISEAPRELAYFSYPITAFRALLEVFAQFLFAHRPHFIGDVACECSIGGMILSGALRQGL